MEEWNTAPHIPNHTFITSRLHGSE